MKFKEWKSGERVVLVRNPDYKHALLHNPTKAGLRGRISFPFSG
jgi:ABC-type transport system substrate-binding protein